MKPNKETHKTKQNRKFNRTGTEQPATSAHKMSRFVLLLWTGCGDTGSGEDMETGKKGWSNLLDVATLSSLRLTVITVLFTHAWEKHTLSVYLLLLCRSEAKAFGNCSPTVNIIKQETQRKGSDAKFKQPLGPVFVQSVQLARVWENNSNDVIKFIWASILHISNIKKATKS